VSLVDGLFEAVGFVGGVLVAAGQHDEVPITIDVVWLIATRQSRS